MAIYHFSGTIVSRSQGRSAVACAAYRAGQKLQDIRADKVHDYTKKQDVAHEEILLPENAPPWMKDREILWNAVEAVEKRKDAQLAREFNFALPKELSLQYNIALAQEFVQQQFVDRGMVADLSVHNDKTPLGEPQPHAHVMLTLREITPEGFGQKVREWNHKENLLVWREEWANSVNRYLALHDHDMRIDHRTLEAQEIDLEPQHKIGAAEAKEKMARAADHQRIAFENGERIFDNPHIALDALTQQQSTFTHHDLAKFIHRHSLDGEQFQQVYDKVKGSDRVLFLGRDEKGLERYTTQEMLTLETRMMTHASELLQRQSHPVFEVSQEVALKNRSLTEEQTVAFDHLVKPASLICVVGYAGTGKSYLLGAVREAYEQSGYRVLGATLSGIAAENLEASSGIESRTLASHLYYWKRNQELLSSRDILVVDEAGMLGSRQMAEVIGQAHRHGAKVMLIGDPEQLQAIEAGAAFRAIAERTGYVELTEVRRQVQDWQKEATRAFAKGLTAEALDRYDQHAHLHESMTQSEAQQSLMGFWNDVHVSQPEKSQIILAYTRKEAAVLNQKARELRHANQELGEDKLLKVASGEKAFAEADRVYFLKNNRDLGVKNGTLGTIERIGGERQLEIRLDSAQKGELGQLVSVNLDHYDYLDHGYAATIHKAQGVTVDRTYLLASPYLDRHATYVAATRHRESVDIFWSQEAFQIKENLFYSLSRQASKDITLDYQKEYFSNQRDIQVDDFIASNPSKGSNKDEFDWVRFDQELHKLLGDKSVVSEPTVKTQSAEKILDTPKFELEKTSFEQDKSLSSFDEQFEKALKAIGLTPEREAIFTEKSNGDSFRKEKSIDTGKMLEKSGESKLKQIQEREIELER